MQLAESRGGTEQNQMNQLRKTPKPPQPAPSRGGGIGDGTSGAGGSGQARAAPCPARGCHRHLLTPSGRAPCPAPHRSLTSLLHINPRFPNLGASAGVFTFFTFLHIFAPAWRAEQQESRISNPSPAPGRMPGRIPARGKKKSLFCSQSNETQGLFLI